MAKIGEKLWKNYGEWWFKKNSKAQSIFRESVAFFTQISVD